MCADNKENLIEIEHTFEDKNLTTFFNISF